ncbi:Protein C27D8.1 [Aphelenchoides avenae]|nr:Protein C27D8.1 [Aphelenchus avenae]
MSSKSGNRSVEKPSTKRSAHSAVKPRDIVHVGSTVSSMKALYVVEKMLGEGGFGAVFRVHDAKDKAKRYAMKVEKTCKDPRKSKLKMEVQILRMVAQERAGLSHFTQIVDKGKKPKYCFLVMTLVGKSLDDLKRKRYNNVFSSSTGLAVSLQCLEALEDLHKFGIIHRDIKPANYAIGLREKAHTVFILDFGIARKITHDDGTLKAPRTKVAFKGTVRFAALSCHKCKELSSKDDCESWFYLLIDILNPNGLPWKKLADKNDVEQAKEDCHEGSRAPLYKGLELETDSLDKVFSYIISRRYVDRVDYQFIYESVKQVAASCKVNLDAPYDWEEQESPQEAPESTANEKTPRLMSS